MGPAVSRPKPKGQVVFKFHEDMTALVLVWANTCDTVMHIHTTKIWTQNMHIHTIHKDTNKYTHISAYIYVYIHADTFNTET